MKIHYLSTHAVLEYDEVKLLTEMGHQVFSNGAYLDPAGNKLLPRPGIPGATYFPEYETLARQYPKTDLPKELIEPFDMIIVMHEPNWIVENWEKIKYKKVIWRSIGQSTRTVENRIRKMRYEGLKIVRYSPLERNIPDYLGEDAIIRFYKDPEEFKDWSGEQVQAINFTQSLKGRRDFCHHDDIMAILDGFPAKIFGTGNDDLGTLNGGELPYEMMKEQMRKNRVFVYGGTWPASYTLAFQEAFMTGIPIVAIGQRLAEQLRAVPEGDRIHFYEIPDFIQNEQNGFISDDVGQLRAYVHRLLQDLPYARRIGNAGRQKAVEVFGKEIIMHEWNKFFDVI